MDRSGGLGRDGWTGGGLGEAVESGGAVQYVGAVEYGGAAGCGESM